MESELNSVECAPGFLIPDTNILPCNGVVNYYAGVFDVQTSALLFQRLLSTIAWEHDELVMFGKRIVTTRRTAWYGDKSYLYAYSGTTKKAKPWTNELLKIKGAIQATTGETFNSCLLNLYDDGGQGMGWHSDDEKALQKHAPIASVSLGAERKFAFRHKISGESVSLGLGDGSLLVMKGETQSFWQHTLPKSKKITTSRINLTFRTIEDG